ncbi:MAG: sigma E protease regulator RseP [Gammaproteobacteria bacterium]|nr:sigma E protease regulator RseP [Gammaproteobacteria bacterium]NIR85421.1 sigma E protease regulator RseP [Gammaproteobacteria bacterium]NIR89348.1 sigma E protease regulator RseP [Gammaproteobacteria bacterium]NIU02805.1 sigma E protease regulator RseP [Gammaproteobacteria bacterium]NIV50329.1 sigma E protease regulator RseP [Gammaproteobacteria bacterium]
MTSVLISILAFIVAIGVLITFHEFGHYWVARRLGVKVLRFSVGFGRPLWRVRAGRDRTEYVVAALPLGGYVKMLDEREGDVEPREEHRAFNRQPVWARIAIVAAGPVFNFIFAVAAYWLMFVIGTTGFKPVVGEVDPQGLAARAGIEQGQTIVAVADEPTESWEAARSALLEAALDEAKVAVVVRGAEGRMRTLELDLGAQAGLLERGQLLDNLGLAPWRPRLEPVLDRVEPGQPAAQAGLTPGDRLVAADGRPIAGWSEWVDYVRARPGESIEVRIRRDGELRTLTLTPQAREGEGGTHGYIGAAVEVPPGLYEGMRVELRYGPLDALGKGFARTGEMSLLTVRMLVKMVTGDVSVENLSGPITIAQYAGYTASVGLAQFLAFLAIVSVSLGILNLLPIPILDGGHLLYYVIEVVKGSPVSESAQALGQRVGLLILMVLMGLAFYNDLTRLMR